MEAALQEEEPDPEEAVVRYLINLQGVFAPHSGVTLFHHLLGTYRILKSWGCNEELCIAGLFHSAYGTPAYHGGPLSVSRRGELREVIGVEAEKVVYQFSSTRWPDVLAGGDEILRTLPISLLTIAAANIVEQWRRLTADVSTSAIRDSLECFARLVPYLESEAARGLAAALQARDANV
jgi:hypothetical protein